QTMHRLWEHALSCAIGAQWLAERTGYTSLSSEAFMGGLLHDIGKLAIIKALDDLLQAPSSPGALSEVLIAEILGTMHEDVGFRLMQSWSLPEAYCSIAVNHHKSDFDGSDALLSLVRLSNLACRKAGKSMHPDPTLSLYAAPEAHFLGVKEIVLAELEIVVEDAGEMEM
ncbi:MAG: HDOD domain-containing protein, partial [Nostocales cyanobacterium W4_Combined_metabat2_030]|nr:HDOD domain-containing protein [Nostocales cyanobacterium W4_Combined_metabat2_030]